MKKVFFPIVIVFAVILSGCSTVDDKDKSPEKEYFTLWNQCEALTALKTYVEDVTNPKSGNYIKEEDRIATFDMDGTFVGELYPTYFEYNLLEYRVLDDPTYKDKAPDDVKEAAQNIRDFVRNGKKLPDHFDMVHAYAAAKAYSGMTLAVGHAAEAVGRLLGIRFDIGIELGKRHAAISLGGSVGVNHVEMVGQLLAVTYKVSDVLSRLFHIVGGFIFICGIVKHTVFQQIVFKIRGIEFADECTVHVERGDTIFRLDVIRGFRISDVLHIGL